MIKKKLSEKIDDLWSGISNDTSCLQEIMDKLDHGELRIVNKIDGKFVVNDYLKKAILLFFKHTKANVMQGAPHALCSYFDKIPLKTNGWTEEDFLRAGFRAVPGCVIRYSAYIAKSVVVMPSFINVGAYVDEGTMIDTNALVGSCAQIGKNCHISDGVTIGGVLEPPQAMPVIIGDNCFIGVRSSVTEGVIVGDGAVVGAGVCLTASTKIVHRETGSVTFGEIPPYSVVVPGTYQSSSSSSISLNCAVVVKEVDRRTREKTSINDLLRC
jgi:2,3,4,5-tetrahydropyridine-2-carboxylate N-succinyltransferase